MEFLRYLKVIGYVMHAAGLEKKIGRIFPVHCVL